MARSSTSNKAARRLRTFPALWSGVALTLAVVVVDLVGGLAPLERWAYDKRATWCQFFSPPPTDKLVLMGIDDSVLESIGAWPWPRSTVADLMDELRLAQPKAVALDVLFTEPQEAAWKPRPDRSFEQLDHDARLAEAFARMGNVLLPVSLPVQEPLNVPPAQRAVQQMLEADLELAPADVATGLQKQGFKDVDYTHLDALIIPARRAAARVRVERAVDALERSGATLPTSAASRPSLPAWDAVRRQVLPKADPTLVSPIVRAASDAYEQVRVSRALARLGRPIPAGLPALYDPPKGLLPIAPLLGAAATTAFVDYPATSEMGDGTVRSVPLFIQHDGLLFSQMGLQLASMMLDADPAAFRYTARSVTLPKAGPGGADLTLPIRTVHSAAAAADVPTVFDIPWSGPGDWQRMLPAAQQIGLTTVYDICRTRQKIRANNLRVDQSVDIVLDKDINSANDWRLGLDRARAAAYFAHRPDLDDADARAGIAAHALEQLKGTNLVEDLERADALSSDEVKLRDELRKAVTNLTQAAEQRAPLQAQLAQQRAALRNALAGKAVLIGWVATANVADQKPTSIHAIAPGVMVHASIVNALLTGQTWRTLPQWVTILLTLAFGLAMTAAVARLSPAKASAAALLLVPTYLLFNGLVFFDWGNTILGAAGPCVAVGMVWAGGTLARLVGEQRERARITRRFNNYVDPQLVDFILESDENVFEGREREMSVVFTDLENFTSLSETLGSQKTVELLNDFMGRATAVIQPRRGLVNKFLGDGIMFFYNAPRPNPHHARDAIETILDLQAMLVTFNEELAARDLPRLALRAGVTTGMMIVGDAGSRERSDYTVIGDLVNLAARLESANKVMGTANLLTAESVDHLGGADTCPYLVRPIARLRVVGQQALVMTYEVLARRDDATLQQTRLAEMSTAVVEAFLDSRPADCLEAAMQLDEAFGPSKLSRMYRERCEQFLNDPEAGEFECQIVLTAK